MSHPRIRPILLASLILGLTACAADEPGDDEASEPAPAPADASPPPEDLGLDRFEQQKVRFTLPWVGGPVNRPPLPDAEPGRFAGASIEAGEGFDRITLAFGDGGFPGYNLAWGESACDGETLAEPPEGEFLRIRLSSIASSGSGLDASADAAPRLLRWTPACRSDDALSFFVSVEARTQLRVVEMRRPLRLLVDFAGTQ